MLSFARKMMRSLTRRILSLTGWRRKRRCALDYQPEPGWRSRKAERLAAYCLGDFKNKPVLPCTKKRRYLGSDFVLLIETDPQSVVTYGHAGQTSRGEKKVVEALVSQRAAIPPGISSWLIRGDSAGLRSDPVQGLHITGMRPASRRDLVLVPTADRNRYLGPNLERQMIDLRKSWVRWEDKSDTVWWGGALSGDRWKDHEPPTLTRREVLSYFRDHPSDQVSLHLTQLQKNDDAAPGFALERRFTKKSAFSHKCMLLLPGNDIASGSSWYFAGNSVVLMPKPHLEHILYFELEPWKHYVPLENDPADILVKLRWVLDNEDVAQKIVADTHERLRWLCGPEYLWACNEVLCKIAQPGSALKS
jgi:hypothetical protein